MNNDLISRRVLKDLISDKSIPIKFEEEKRGNWQNSMGVLLSDIYKAIDNAPTVEPKQGDCEKCDFRKFTETFIDGVVDVMNKNDITSIEQLQEILEGGTENETN